MDSLHVVSITRRLHNLPHYYLPHLLIVHHGPRTKTICAKTMWPHQIQHLTQNRPLTIITPMANPQPIAIELIKGSLKFLQPILGFSHKSYQILSLTITISSTPNQHTNMFPNPITCLIWNYGHLSRTLEDIHQLTTIDGIPSLFLFIHETKFSKDKPTRYINMQFSSYKYHKQQHIGCTHMH